MQLKFNEIRQVEPPSPILNDQKISADQICSRFGLEGQDYILFLGRLVPEKGIHYLIDAYNESNVDKKLVIAGAASDTDTYYAELKEKAKSAFKRNYWSCVLVAFVLGLLITGNSAILKVVHP
mgnify:CR=1 FL=1